MVLESGSIGDNLSKLRFVKFYKDSILINSFSVVEVNSSLNTDLLSYNIIVPKTLNDLRYLKREINYFSDSSGIYNLDRYTYVKLFVPKGINRIELVDDSNSIIAVIVPETRDNFVNDIYKNYSIDETNYDKAVVFTNDPEFGGVKFHKNVNLDHHKEHVIFSYYDQDFYNFLSKIIVDQIIGTQNMNVHSGVLITDDFSKLFLGTCYKGE